MGKPHKHAELIKAWADGAAIQFKHDLRGWIDCNPCWEPQWEYRIKPEPKPDLVKVFKLESHPLAGLRFFDITGFQRDKDEQRIQVTFDAETGEVKSAEVIYA